MATEEQTAVYHATIEITALLEEHLLLGGMAAETAHDALTILLRLHSQRVRWAEQALAEQRNTR